MELGQAILAIIIIPATREAATSIDLIIPVASLKTISPIKNKAKLPKINRIGVHYTFSIG